MTVATERKEELVALELPSQLEVFLFVFSVCFLNKLKCETQGVGPR